MSVWTLYFDGLCEPRNPGGRMAWGWVLEIPGLDPRVGNGTLAPHESNTNNRAEYMALGYGLRAVGEQGNLAYSGIVIRGDSKLVIEQVNNHWAVNAPALRALHARIHELLVPLKPWACEWIPREKNEEADRQSRLGYHSAEGRMPPERKKFVRH